jgi:3-oxoacyl-[acyl-carrier-protein] synthase II
LIAYKLGKQTKTMLRRAETEADFRAEFEERPSQRVVISAFSQETPLGGTEETFKALLAGKSGVQRFEVGNFRTNIAAPIKFNPGDHFTKRELRELSPLAALAIVKAREAGFMAGLLDPSTKKIKSELNKHRIGSWVSTGMGAVDRLIDTYNTLHAKDKNNQENPRAASRRILPTEILKVLPDINGHVAIALGCSGWGGNSIEACATGLSNPVEGARLIREGKADVVFAGAFEYPLELHPEVTIGLFASPRAISARNDEPGKASRPFSIDRDGFVFGSGGGIVVLESEEHAIREAYEFMQELLDSLNLRMAMITRN